MRGEKNKSIDVMLIKGKIFYNLIEVFKFHNVSSNGSGKVALNTKIYKEY